METGVDLVVENLMKLLNTDDELIVKAYKKNRIQKEQIEWFYQEMQFMRTFLKDSEDKRKEEHEKELKDVVARIRDVTGEVDVIVDSFILSAHFRKHMALAFEHHRREPRRNLREEMRYRGKFFLSPIEKILKSHMPIKNHPGCSTSSLSHGDLSEYFKSVTENIVRLANKISDLLETLEEDLLSFEGNYEEIIRIFSGIECDPPVNKCLFFRRKFMKEIASIKTRITTSCDSFYQYFHLRSYPLEVLSQRLSQVLMMGSRLACPAFCQLDDCLFLSNMLEEMVYVAGRQLGVVCVAIKYIKSIKTMAMKGLSATWLDSHIAVELGPLLDLSVRMIDQAEKIRRVYGGVLAEIKCIKREVMKINDSGLSISGIYGSFALDKVSYVIEEIKSIKTYLEIFENKMCGTGVLQNGESSERASTRAPRHQPIVDEEMVVGFDDEKTTVEKLLIEDHERQLKVISIIGMPGLGKTTLAKIIYNGAYIVDHFPTRAWTYVSQAYRKRDLLSSILCSTFNLKDEISDLSDEVLGEKLYRRLKGKKYLIVMDDIWDIEAWDDCRRYFPDDYNGSRILFTSRVLDVSGHFRSHPLRFLNEDESWDLFSKRVFQKENCPAELMEIGKQIAKKCQGLPLAIVVIAGLLKKKDKTLEWWRHVAKSVGSYIVSDPDQYMDTLALSYNHLPHHLKSCFLYFSAFPEDYEIPVRKLVSLWIAEGFIHQIGQRILEDVAEGYLMDLIDRSLVLVVRRKSTGGIKSCRVHDLLHDLCLKKAEEENFLQQVCWYEEVSSSGFTPDKQLFLPIAAKQRRLCVRSCIFGGISSEFSAQNIRSFLYFGSEKNPIPRKDMSFIERGFNLLRVLDLSSISISHFPYSIAQLALLRYLAIKGKKFQLPNNISEFQNLETLIVSGELYYLPTSVWKMVKLRHLCIGGENVIPDSLDMDIYSLDSLQTISQVCPSKGCQKVLTRTPNLRKLVLCGSFESQDHSFWFPELEFLNHLKILKLFNRFIPDNHTYNLQGVKFPPNLKELTLSKTHLAWEEMSIIGSLPNLESLKLEFQACVGPLWETSDGGFCRLKFLRFYYMNIEQWNASSNHFPILERLVFHRCRKLENIPSDLGNIDTLQMIEVSCCSDSMIYSAKQIQEYQLDMANEFLKIHIVSPPDWELTQ